MQQTDHILFQLKIKELGEEKLLKQYSNFHAQEKQEEEQLQKFISDQTKRADQSNTGSKTSKQTFSKTKAEAGYTDRRKGIPVKTTIVSSSNYACIDRFDMLRILMI